MGIIIRITILVFFVCVGSTVSISNELEPTETIISVLNVREDLINQKTTNEILLFAKFSMGEYRVVSHWDNKQKIMISQRKSILGKHSKFRAYRHGLVLGEITVSQVQIAPFDCEELIIGVSRENIITDISKHKSNVSGTSIGRNQHGDFKYKNTRFIAINSDSPSTKTQQYSRPLTIPIPEKTKNVIYNFVTKSLITKNSQIKQTEIKITTLLSYNLNNDSKIEYLIVAKGVNDTTKQSGIFVVNIESGTVIPLLNKGMRNRPSSWGNGYELLDVLDLDGDSIPELIFETKGYESTGYEVFKLEKNTFIKVFSDVTYGC